MNYNLKIYKSENGKKYELVNEFNNSDISVVQRNYISALKQYCFKKDFHNIKTIRYYRIPYSNIEKITIVYCNTIGYDYSNLAYYKYEYVFEGIGV